MNILTVFLDSARYDTFKTARAPNMKDTGPLEKAWSFACCTFPSMVGYFLGYPPIGAGGPIFPTYDPNSAKLVPRFFMEKGYSTALFSCNAMILMMDRSFGGHLSKFFKHFRCMEYLKQKQTATREIFRDASALVTDDSPPIFMVLHLMATHFPYFDGLKLSPRNRKDPQANFDDQVRAIEFVDTLIPELYEAFKERIGKTRVVITSDHGEVFGVGHNPKDFGTLNPKLFEIPLIRGELK